MGTTKPTTHSGKWRVASGVFTLRFSGLHGWLSISRPPNLCAAETETTAAKQSSNPIKLLDILLERILDPGEESEI